MLGARKFLLLFKPQIEPLCFLPVDIHQLKLWPELLDRRYPNNWASSEYRKGKKRVFLFNFLFSYPLLCHMNPLGLKGTTNYTQSPLLNAKNLCGFKKLFEFSSSNYFTGVNSKNIFSQFNFLVRNIKKINSTIFYSQ